MARKREEPTARGGAQRGARGKSRSNSNGQDNTNFHSLKQQLVAMGLMLREIPGDGNCLFRALGDQLDGSPNYHAKHRQDVVAYMREHREDFEPFVEDDVPFERHLSNLAELGTYGGNECIVAFARLHIVTVVIHQLNTPLWTIGGSDGGQKPQKELHISYHNGDHYNSVRKIGDATSAPSNIKLAVPEKDDKKAKSSDKGIGVNGSHSQGYKDYSSWADADVDYSEPVYEGLSKEEQLVMDQTGCQDLQLIRMKLETYEYDVHEATDDIISTIVLGHRRAGEYLGSSNGVGLWGPNGTGTRVVGEPAAAVAQHSSIHPAIQPSIHPSYQKKTQNQQDKLQQRLKINQHISNSKRKELKKHLRKQQANERKRQESNGLDVVDDDYGSDKTPDQLSIVRDIGCLSI